PYCPTTSPLPLHAALPFYTTASDALWAGCPVLTTPGGTFAARVAGSLNHHLGMQRMNRGDDADFIDFAIRIGRDVALRAELRAEDRKSTRLNSSHVKISYA